MKLMEGTSGIIRSNAELLPFFHSSFDYKRWREISKTTPHERFKDAILEIYIETPFCGFPSLTAKLKRP